MSPHEMDELLPKISQSSEENKYPCPESMEYLVRIYSRVDQVCRTIYHSQDYKHEEEKAKREWRSVSMVLDRCFFIVFVFLVFFTCMSIFSQIPDHSHLTDE